MCHGSNPKHFYSVLNRTRAATESLSTASNTARRTDTRTMRRRDSESSRHSYSLAKKSALNLVIATYCLPRWR